MGVSRRTTTEGTVARSRCAAFGFSLPVALLVLVLGACSDPDRAILERLDEADRARFQRGRAVAQPCWTCHDLAGDVRKVGPSLLGLYGRPAGMASGNRASPALREAKLVWDDRSLARFLRDPAGAIPGNAMVSPGVRNPESLRDLLFYLRHVTRPGAREPDAE